jgi:hypothetical protein
MYLLSLLGLSGILCPFVYRKLAALGAAITVLSLSLDPSFSRW